LIQPLFDFAESQARKREGMQLAEDNDDGDLETARVIAVEIASAKASRETNADEVGKVLFARHGIKTLGHRAGSIFKSELWEFTGGRLLSVRKKNNGRELKVWRLR